MNKLVYSITGAAVAATSVALITTYAVKKKKEEAVGAGMLIAGLAGLVLGAVIAYEPTRQASKRLVSKENILNESDVDLMSENISEVLGTGVDRGQKAPSLRQIEVDEEASIEDFIQ
ncbi:MAG: hypothetical protein IKC31_05105 [Clostridia bacterium]|nr:hypothetical protein [Clostridia bacterium]MBR2926935.1 hypothetical protein [Clostridia bacterium]